MLDFSFKFLIAALICVLNLYLMKNLKRNLKRNLNPESKERIQEKDDPQLNQGRLFVCPLQLFFNTISAEFDHINCKTYRSIHSRRNFSKLTAPKTAKNALATL